MDFLQGNELSRLSISAFEHLTMLARCCAKIEYCSVQREWQK
jgi:hypothetical protein